jgi:DNA-binding CsgD family transcriptional regulator
MAHTEYWLANTNDAAAPPLLSVEDMALKCIESWTEAVLFLSENDLRVVWMNAAAESVLREHEIVLNEERLELAQANLQESFDDFLSQTDGETASWILEPRRGLGTLVFRRRSIPGSSYLLLCIHDPERPSTHLPDVGSLLGLTPSESRIIKGLIDGRRADELAQDLRVSLETIRTHIRRIYVKVGVNSREQLIARVSAFRVP